MKVEMGEKGDEKEGEKEGEMEGERPCVREGSGMVGRGGRSCNCHSALC